MTNNQSQYAKSAHYNTTHLRRQSFYALPQAQWQLLAQPPICYLETLSAVDDAIDANARLAEAIVATVQSSFPITKDAKLWQGTATSNDVEKARSTLRQFWRDWSADGAGERDACLWPIINDMVAERSSRTDIKEGFSVLVPGAGLARLVYELCSSGFSVEGNEISYHQLLASNYILNHTPGAESHTIYPWIHTFSNHLTRKTHLEHVRIPDVHPGTQLAQLGDTAGDMSMTASDFILLYGQAEYQDMFDAVATCFFIDTAPNIIRYIETISNCLKSGGIWSNLGPLLWHFENDPPGKNDITAKSETKGLDSAGIADPGSVELTNDEVLALIEHFGFVIERKEDGIKAGYIQDPRSMLQSTYHVSHWVARKM